MSTTSRRGLLLGASAWCFSSAPAWAQSPVRLLVVVSKTSSLADISLGQLRQVYLGKQVSLAGRTSIPFNHPPRSPDRVGFDRLVLRMSPEEVARYWVDQRIRGGGAPPRTTDSAGLLLRVVAHLPGALGYVHEGFGSPDLKVLTIEGRAPGDASYPLVYRP